MRITLVVSEYKYRSYFPNNFTFYKWCVTKVAHCNGQLDHAHHLMCKQILKAYPFLTYLYFSFHLWYIMVYIRIYSLKLPQTCLHYPINYSQLIYDLTEEDSKSSRRH